MKIPTSISQKIDQRKKENALRYLSDLSDKVDFFSNDYLGMSQWNSHFPLLNDGSTGSRLLSGNQTYYETVEAELADFFGHDSALLFNSGYDANLGVFSSIPLRGDTVIYDQLIHASIRDGIRMSNAQSFSFLHNDLTHLEQRLKQAQGNVYVAVEALYSMDGDVAPLRALANLCQQYGAFLIVDEAHSGGVYGVNGEGLVSSLGLDESIFLKIITFGKAYGSHGALVLGANEIKTYLINFCRPFIYTTAMSPQTVSRIQSVVNQVKWMTDEREKLKDLIQFFQSTAKGLNLKVINSSSAIQAILISGNEAAKSVEKKCVDAGFALKAVLAPTVPKGQERIRICLHSFNTKAQILSLLQTI